MTVSGIVIVVKDVQFWNALFPILVTLSGIAIFVKDSQFWNAKSQIYSQFSFILQVVISFDFDLINHKYGLVSLPKYNALSYSLYCNAKQLLNASVPIKLQFSFILQVIISFDLASFKYKYGLFSFPKYYALSYSLYCNDVQPKNALFPILVTLSRIVILVNDAQFTNAPAPILVTLSGIVILVIFLHSLNAAEPILVTVSGIVILVKDVQFPNA